MISTAAVVELLERRFPPQLAASWDQVGLQVGTANRTCSRVLFSVDPNLDVIDEAIARSCQLIVTHHPLLMRGIHKVTDDSWRGRAVQKLIANRVDLYSAHTNADAATGGVNDALADALGMSD